MNFINTDKDIIKVLECCNNTKESECSECPLLNVECSKYDVYKSALDLINRQKAEIERYKNTVGELLVNDDGIVVGLANGKETEYIPKKIHVIWENMAVKRAKSEALKEFQSKSKEMLIGLYKKYYRKANRTAKRDMFYQGRAEAIWECICRNDNLVKEMTDEKE